MYTTSFREMPARPHGARSRGIHIQTDDSGRIVHVDVMMITSQGEGFISYVGRLDIDGSVEHRRAMSEDRPLAGLSALKRIRGMVPSRIPGG